MRSPIIIGTRGSALALWQANFVKEKLDELGYPAQLIIIKTKGDKIQHLSFDKLEGKGFFTKEIEDALYDKRIDIAIHSCKDLETVDPEGLCIAAIFNRAQANDSILFKPNAWQQLQEGCLLSPCFGTSSARRKSQILREFPGAQFKDIRGNVPTRIQKLRDDDSMDAIVLAKAGYGRLNISVDEFHELVMDPESMVPAAAQGALAIQCREKDSDLMAVLSKINEAEVNAQVTLERQVLKALGGGCQKPSAVHCRPIDNGFQLLLSHADFADESGALYAFEAASPQDFNIPDIVGQLKKKSSFTPPN